MQIQDGGRTPYWKSFLAISRRHNGRSTRNLEHRWSITCRYRSRYQNRNFRKFKMADGRHFENSFKSISQWELSDFEQIWYADANFHSQDGYLTKRNSKFFKFKMADGRHIDNRFFGYISAPFWPINAKFGTVLVRFRGNLVCRCKFTFRGWLLDKKKFEIF